MRVQKPTWLPSCVILMALLAFAAGQSGYYRYDLSPDCYTPQTCSADGRCLASNAITSWDACPNSTYYEVSSSLQPDTTGKSGTCSWSGCGLGGCRNNWGQVGASAKCGLFSMFRKAYCCPLRTAKLCRKWLPCRFAWAPYTPVFAAGGGAWNHSAPSATNGYIAARVSAGIYNGDTSRLDGVPYPDAAFADWFCAAMVRNGAADCRVRVAGKDIEYAVVGLGASALVAFRGTESAADMLNDAALLLGTTMPSANAYGMVGVAAAYDSLVRQVLPLMATDLANMTTTVSGLPVWFAGHSLGGAYATIAALYWAKVQGKHVAGVYTYGTSRPGNSTFAAVYNSTLGAKTFRHELTFNGKTVDKVVAASYGGLAHVGIPVPVDRYASACAAASVGRRRRRGLAGRSRTLLGAAASGGSSGGSSSPTPPPPSPQPLPPPPPSPPASPAPVATASDVSAANGIKSRYATADFTKRWLDPAVAYTPATKGAAADCTDALGLCHGVAFYWRSLYTCLTEAQRAAVGEF